MTVVVDNKNDLDRQQNVVDLFVGARMRMRRITIGMSESDLAGATGIPVERLRAFESGEERLGIPRLLQFSQLLSVPVSWFFSGIGFDGEVQYGGRFTPPNVTSQQAAESEQLKQLNFSFQSLSRPDYKRLVVQLTDALADIEALKKVDNSD